MKKYTWYSDELINALNKLGYVHFAVKKPMYGFEEGKAFYYDEESMTYGHAGFITENHLEDVYKNRDYIIYKANK